MIEFVCQMNVVILIAFNTFYKPTDSFYRVCKLKSAI